MLELEGESWWGGAWEDIDNQEFRYGVQFPKNCLENFRATKRSGAKESGF